MDDLSLEEYWTVRYKEDRTGWDIGHISTPLKVYIDQLTHKDMKILTPGAGNGYEAEYLFKNGFRNVNILDISETPLKSFSLRNPDFPKNQLIHDDFFKHNNSYDLIIEQTFFCSFTPTTKNRKAYAKKVSELLVDKGKLVGLWFDFPLTEDVEKRPFGGSKTEYLSYFKPFFKVITFETAYNSILKRSGNELFGVFVKSVSI
ncbi:SAM-dependent methyltransferase [Patiriisocius marinistellae]|uniref:SAM-dependent methyltransferase n=1 Tax=Patiriisocius marinistellae TaxID=2494560 RepID=A0A5J4G1I5_9FLAO|nr:methyltransferase domain-containing protein [Patiriisocius marinistellae]GEQ86519.1 SAM-dependent methyltransferase [Patiriisocius marinistellae]